MKPTAKPGTSPKHSPVLKNLDEEGVAIPEKIGGEPLFQVFVLGAKGAGKTVFLSSLYKQLSVQNDSRNNYYLETVSQDQATFLLRLYDRIINPGRDWPPGSFAQTEIQFRCFHSPRKLDIPAFPLFRFVYHDYPGGFVSEGLDQGGFVREKTREAQSILALIDGEKILEQLEDFPPRDISLDAELTILVSTLQHAVKRPIQFIITKSDLFSDISFGQIKKEIYKTQSFQNFVTQRHEFGLPTYLIPVSAVGNGFAYFDRSTMSMKKNQDAHISPYNLDLTIGLTIMDQLELIAKRAEKVEGLKYSLSRLLSRIARLLGLLRSVDSVAAELSSLLSAALGIPVQLNTVLSALNKASQRLQLSAEELERQVAEAVKKVSDRRTAFEAITLVQKLLQDDFFARYPESDLRRSA
jgi:hypothetical protein